jgi:hypothetical protein
MNDDDYNYDIIVVIRIGVIVFATGSLPKRLARPCAVEGGL